MNVGEKIIELRNRKGWSQYRLYKEAGISQAALSRIEQGERYPNTATLQKIASALGVSMAEFDDNAEIHKKAANKVIDLVIADMDQQDLSAKEERAADIFKSLSKEEQQKMLMPFLKQTSAYAFRIDEAAILKDLKSLPLECQQALVVLIKNLALSQQ